MTLQTFSPLNLLTADAPSAVGGAYGSPMWGIFSATTGQPILQADSTGSVEYARDYQISDYPQEQGAFASYNKVQVPFQAKVSFLINQDRATFLNSVESAVASLAFVTVYTPEVFYPNANLTHYSYRRESRSGVTLIRVDVWCEEVRIPSQPAQNGQIANGATSSTNASSPTQSGLVQGGATYGPTSATDASDVGPFSTDPSLAVQPVSADGYTSLPDVPSGNLGSTASITQGPGGGGGVSTVPAGVPVPGGGEASLTTNIAQETAAAPTPFVGGL